MRIILTSNFSPWSPYTGGAPRSVHYLATALCRRGHHVTVVFTKAPWERITPDRPPLYDLRWAALPNPRSHRIAPLRPLTAFTVAHVVRKALEEQLTAHPEERAIVHANGEEGALLPRLRQRVPFGLLVTPRYPSLPDELLRPHPTSLVRRLGFLVRHTKYVTLGVALRGADYCSPPSKYGADLITRAYRLDPKRVRPVHNGVPEEFLEYAWKRSPGPVDPRPMLFFGRFAESKGADLLLEAFAEVSSRVPQDLVLVGAGPHRARYLDRIRALKMDDRVHLRTWAGHHELGRLLTESSFAVLPSREENLSLAVLSAMAVGTPLIATRVGGTSEVVEHEKNGLLCEPDDVAGLRDAIDRLIGDPDYAAALGRAGRESVRRSFTWDAAAGRFEELYATLAAPPL